MLGGGESLTHLPKIEQLFDSNFHAVNSLFVEPAIQCIMRSIVEMIVAGYQIPSNSANNGRTVLDQDFRIWRFRIVFINHLYFLLVSINRTTSCMEFQKDKAHSPEGRT